MDWKNSRDFKKLVKVAESYGFRVEYELDRGIVMNTQFCFINIDPIDLGVRGPLSHDLEREAISALTHELGHVIHFRKFFKCKDEFRSFNKIKKEATAWNIGKNLCKKLNIPFCSKDAKFWLDTYKR